jgi:hypothetical protein
MNSNKINIWDLGDRINIKVNVSFIDFINEKIKEKYKTKRNIHKELIKYYKIPFSVFRDRMKKGYKYFIDLEILLNLCKILNISLDKLQSNILAYKTRGGYNSIRDPILPIKITPIFDMLIAHFIGDGFVVDPKRRRKIYFGYRQYDKKYRNLFIKKVESIFGKIEYVNDYMLNKGTTQVYFPVVVSRLMFKLYGLNPKNFKSDQAIIPKEVLRNGWKYKLAFLIAIIIDEGHIDSDLIIIRMKNNDFMGNLQNLCNDLEYNTSMKKGKDCLTNLYILSKSLKKFYMDYNSLLKEYPEIDMGYKGDKIKEFINRLDKPKVYIKGNKPRILSELSKESLTVNELATKLNMTRQGARYLVNALLNEGKIESRRIVKFGNRKYKLR